MGKKKNKRFLTPKNNPTGVQIINLDEDDLMNGCPVETLSDIIHELQSPDEQTRDYACTRIASLAGQHGAISQLLKIDVIRTLAPLVVDHVPSVRHRALGALRNIAVHGGLEACHDMVLKDVLTPLVALFQKYDRDWVPEKESTKHLDTRLDTFRQAVLVLWSLCEASDAAVGIFNKENLMTRLLPCLHPSVYGYPLATAVAQCLFTVTERNQDAIDLCRSDQVLPMLQLLAQRSDPSSDAVLFQAVALGLLLNVLGDKLVAAPGLSEFVAALSHILSIELLPFLEAGAEVENMEIHSEISGDSKQSHILAEDEDEAKYKEVLNILDAQRICLELVTNICSSPEDDWEEMENSSESSDDINTAELEDEIINGDNNNLDLFGTPVEVHEALTTNNIVSKVMRLAVPTSQQLTGEVKSKNWSKKIHSRLQSIQSRALLCLNNLMEMMPVESLGSVEDLHQLWDSLTQQLLHLMSDTDNSQGATSAAATVRKANADDLELLEALVSAMRAVLQKLLPLDSPRLQQVSLDEVRMLTRLAEASEGQVQLHIMRILASMALALVPMQPQHVVVEEVGGFLITVATHSPDLVKVAEALDALFDVFADDATDPVKISLHMAEKLRPLPSQLRAKMHIQRKVLGEHYLTVKTTRDNLIRFIRYIESRGKS